MLLRRARQQRSSAWTPRCCCSNISWSRRLSWTWKELTSVSKQRRLLPLKVSSSITTPSSQLKQPILSSGVSQTNTCLPLTFTSKIRWILYLLSHLNFLSFIRQRNTQLQQNYGSHCGEPPGNRVFSDGCLRQLPPRRPPSHTVGGWHRDGQREGPVPGFPASPGGSLPPAPSPHSLTFVPLIVLSRAGDRLPATWTQQQPSTVKRLLPCRPRYRACRPLTPESLRTPMLLWLLRCRPRKMRRPLMPIQALSPASPLTCCHSPSKPASSGTRLKCWTHGWVLSKSVDCTSEKMLR